MTNVAVFPDCYAAIPGTEPRSARIKGRAWLLVLIVGLLIQNLNRGQRMLNLQSPSAKSFRVIPCHSTSLEPKKENQYES